MECRWFEDIDDLCFGKLWCTSERDDPVSAEEYGLTCVSTCAPVYPDYVGADMCGCHCGTCAV